jgi:hypothetical protein
LLASFHKNPLSTLNLSKPKEKSSLECLGYRSSKTHQNPPQKKLGKKKKREKDYDYSDSGIKATRAPQAILRGGTGFRKKRNQRLETTMKRSSLVLPSAYDEEEGKRPSPRSKAARRQAHVQERRSFRRKDDRSGKRHSLQSVGHSQTG